MLHGLKELHYCTAVATDGEIGEVKDVHFDDKRWAIRYIVVETGGWPSGRKVLISPVSVRDVNWDDELMSVKLDQQQVWNSPGIDTDERVSRQYESGEFAQTQLRSSKNVTGYEIMATDGSIGIVENFVFDDKTWAIRYIVVDTRKWLPGKHVLLAPEWIDGVRWPEHRVYVNVTRRAVERSPQYDPSRPLSMKYEKALREHHGRATQSA